MHFVQSFWPELRRWSWGRGKQKIPKIVVANVYLPAPSGTFIETVLVFGLDSVLSSSLLAITAIWLPTDVVLTIFGLAVVNVHVVVPVVWVFRNSKIDCDLSRRFNVCNRIGPTIENEENRKRKQKNVMFFYADTKQTTYGVRRLCHFY